MRDTKKKLSPRHSVRDFYFFNVQEYFCQLHNITLTVTHFSLCCYALKQLILITQYYILTPVS